MICPWCIDYDPWRVPNKETTFLPGDRCATCKRVFPQSDDEWKRAFHGLNDKRWSNFSYALGNAQGVPDRVYVGFAGTDGPQEIVRENVKGLFKKRRFAVALPPAEQMRLFRQVCTQTPAQMYDITTPVDL